MNAWHHLPDLYFLHIPKTAGTSVRAWAEGFYPQDAILPGFHLKQLEELPDEVIREARFASGHFGWRFVERAEAVGKDVKIFTFLRDVVSLRMSFFGYAAKVPEKAMSLADGPLLALIRETVDLANDPDMIRFITETEIDVEGRLAAHPGPHSGQNPMLLNLVSSGSEAGLDLEDEAAVAPLAAKRLEDMLLAGVVEDMNGSLALLCARLGLPFIPIKQSLNTTGEKLKPSRSYGQLVRRRNEHDEALHRQLTERVAQQKAALLEQYGVSSVEDLAAPMRAAFLATERGVERMREAGITMADGLVSEGLAPRFFFEDYQRWLRWAGRQSTLYLPLDTGSDRHVRFEIATTMNDRIRDELSLSVNGHDIPLTRDYEQWVDEAFHLICEGTIPAAAMQPGAQYTALDLAAPEDVETEYPDQMGARAAFALADIRIA